MGVLVLPVEQSAVAARPFLKWAGGKSRLVPAIGAHLPAQIGTYFEPFLGSGALFFALANAGRFQRAVLNDQNRELIDVFRAIKKDVASVIEALSRHEYDEALYYELRALDPQSLDLSERAARTIYLNRAGYNGLYRVNRSGQFNVPFGRHRQPKICNPERLRAAAAALRKVKLSVGDFEKACESAGPGDAVYFDPPYVPVSKTSSFTAYSSTAFEAAEHERLARCFAELAKRNVTAVLSNSDTPLTRRLYTDWHTETILVSRSINSNGQKRGGVAELLVRNKRRSK